MAALLVGIAERQRRTRSNYRGGAAPAGAPAPAAFAAFAADEEADEEGDDEAGLCAIAAPALGIGAASLSATAVTALLCPL